MRGKVIGRLPAQRILVTGAPRSATTFVGTVLSWPRTVDYLHEPFNPLCGLPSITFNHVDLDGLEGEYGDQLRAEFAALLQYEPVLKTGFYRRDPGLRRWLKPMVGSRGPFYLRVARLNPFSRSVVVKDPFAVMALRTLISEWGFSPVCLVRHPLAYVASLRRLGWRPTRELSDIAAQPHVVERLEPEDQAALQRHPDSEAQAAAYLWRILARELARVADADPSVVLLTHEELSSDAVETFRALYDELDLPWSDRTARRIVRLTGPANPAEAAGDRSQAFARDSEALLDYRLSTVDAETRDEVWPLVAEVASRWYTESSLRPGFEPWRETRCLVDGRDRSQDHGHVERSTSAISNSFSILPARPPGGQAKAINRPARRREIALIDPTISTRDVTGELIMQSCRTQLDDVLRVCTSYPAPSTEYAAQPHATASDAELAIVCGGDLFDAGSHAPRARGPSWAEVRRARGQCVLMGAGWHQPTRGWMVTCGWKARTLLSHHYLHAVSDPTTMELLRRVGVENVALTGCPTTWGLGDVEIRSSRGARALVALDASVDGSEFISTFVSEVDAYYDDVVVLPHRPIDDGLAHLLPERWRILRSGLSSLDDELIAAESLDYVGTGLHPGIRSLQHGVRAFIFRSDPRTQAVCSVVGLETFDKGEVHGIREVLEREEPTVLSPPTDVIQEWLAQFLWAREEPDESLGAETAMTRPSHGPPVPSPALGGLGR